MILSPAVINSSFPIHQTLVKEGGPTSFRNIRHYLPSRASWTFAKIYSHLHQCILYPEDSLDVPSWLGPLEEVLRPSLGADWQIAVVGHYRFMYTETSSAEMLSRSAAAWNGTFGLLVHESRDEESMVTLLNERVITVLNCGEDEDKEMINNKVSRA